MNDKSQMIAMLDEEFHSWEAVLAGMSEAQATTPLLPSDWSIKDVLAHLRAWQQVSIARLEAALDNTEPELPIWLAGLSPDSDEYLEKFNDWIYQAYRERPWANVYQVWREGFLHFLELAQAIPEQDLLEAGRYPWLEGNPLIAVLRGTYKHHHDEHLQPLLALLREHRTASAE